MEPREPDQDGTRSEAANTGEPATRTQVEPPGLRPRAAWVLGLFALRFLAARLDPAHADALGSAVVALGIVALHVPSRAWCSVREHLLASVACSAAALSLACDLAAPNSSLAWIVRAVSAIAAAAWAVLWIRSGRRE